MEGVAPVQGARKGGTAEVDGGPAVDDDESDDEADVVRSKDGVVSVEADGGRSANPSPGRGCGRGMASHMHSFHSPPNGQRASLANAQSVARP